MYYSITRNGKPLDEKLYTICKKTKTFSSEEDKINIDFANKVGWTFNIGYGCTLRVGSYCIINADSYCSIKASNGCIFNVNHCCTFDTGGHCTFNTGDNCTFSTSFDCIFKTGESCTFLVFYEGKYTKLDLENSCFVVFYNEIIEIKNKSYALLNLNHENEQVRNACKMLLGNR